MIVTMSLSEPEFQAWNVSERQFPKDGTKTEQLKFILNYAVLAPSSHNTQPWLFKIVGDKIIELYADRTRCLPLVDPMDRALTISCGAALSHLLIAVRHLGYAYDLKLFPDSNDKDLISRIIIDGGRKEPKTEENALFEAITKRRTNRLKFEDRELEESLISKLRAVTVTNIAEEESAGEKERREEQETAVWFYIAKEEYEKDSLTDLIAEGDRIQLSDKRFRRELPSNPGFIQTEVIVKMACLVMHLGIMILCHIWAPLLYEPLTSVRVRQQKTVNLLLALLPLLFLERDPTNNWIGSKQAWP